MKLTHNFARLQSKDNAESVLESIGFEPNTAIWLATLIGEEDFRDSSIALDWIHNFVKFRIESLESLTPGDMKCLNRDTLGK